MMLDRKIRVKFVIITAAYMMGTPPINLNNVKQPKAYPLYTLLGTVNLKNMPTKQRQEAMTWWNNLSWTDKGNLMDGEYKHRHPQSLTGSEIERLWTYCA